MKQKLLSQTQMDIVHKIEELFDAAAKHNINFIYDNADGTLSAYNAVNVEYGFRDCEVRDDNNVEKIDWDYAYVLKLNSFKGFDSNWECFCLRMK